MIRSMTAFARSTAQTEWGDVCWELRSVNHRYLEISTRLPEELRQLEAPIRERISKALQRGKIDCNLRFQSDSHAHFELNTSLVQQLLALAEQVNQTRQQQDEIPTIELLRWPGVMEATPPDFEALSKILLQTLDEAIEQLLAYRQREGEQIKQLLEQRCQAIAKEVSTVREELPGILQSQRERLKSRLHELEQNLNMERLEQEMVFMAQKMDVAEELERIEAHLLEVNQALKEDKPTGRRLDFLMQELNREANTLGSKSIHTRTSMASVNLKVLIEQMREQIQNVE